MSLVDFILSKRGDTGFLNKDDIDIKMLIILHSSFNTILTHQDEDGNFDGIMLWNVEKYFPLTVCITECVSTGKRSLVEMLHNFGLAMPPDFVCIAKRNKATKDIQYKNPRRILKLLENYGRS
jgi:hypothetical protein